MAKTDINSIVTIYLLSVINPENYELPMPKTDIGKKKLVARILASEATFYKSPRSNDQKSIADWLRGLPSVLDIEFMNDGIAKLLIQWGLADREKMDNQESDYFSDRMDHYYNRIAFILLTWSRKEIESAPRY